MGIAQGMRELAEAIASSGEERTKRLGEIGQETKGLVNSFQTSRRETATQLRKELTQGVENRRSEVKGIIEGFQSSRNEMGTELRGELAQSRATIKSEVGKKLEDFQSSRREMGTQLREDLARDRADRKSEVEKGRSEVRQDLKEASDAWQQLVSKREISAKEVPEEKEKAPAPEKEEVPDWEEKLLTAVREHPEGVTLAQVAESLGVAVVVLGRASRSLLDKGKIRKEEGLYFPMTEEEG